MLGRPVAQELAPADPEFLQVEAAQRLEFQLEKIAAPVGGAVVLGPGERIARINQALARWTRSS
jgi:hypothetical protein